MSYHVAKSLITCASCPQQLSRTDVSKGLKRCVPCRAKHPGNPKHAQTEKVKAAQSWWATREAQTDRGVFNAGASARAPLLSGAVYPTGRDVATGRRW